MSTLTDLRDRVAALKGAGSYEAAEVEYGIEAWLVGGVVQRWQMGGSDFRIVRDGKVVSYRAPPYTTSVDAVLSLIERTLPAPETWAGSPPSSGWKISLYRGMTPTGAPYASCHAMIRRHAEAEKDCIAPTPALALLLALLEAKSSGETS